MTEGPLLQTPGEMLAAARTAAGLSVDQIAERTKIPPASIEAIERDEYHKISGQLYVKSFLRSFAAEVGLEVQTVLDQYARFSGGMAEADSGDRRQVWHEEEVVVRRVGLPWGRLALVAAVLVVVVGGGALLLGLLRGNGDESGSAGPGAGDTAAQVATSGQASTPDTLAVGAAGDAGRPGPGDGSGSGAGDGEKEAAAPAPAEQSPQADPPPQAVGGDDPAPARPARAAFPGTSETPFAGSGRPDLVLRILCDRRISIEVRADGDQRFLRAAWGSPVLDLPDRDLTPGTVYRCREGFVAYWGAEDHFSLKLGEVAGVEVRLDGVPYPVAGLSAGQEVILDRHSIGR